jgi:hypothetical protein
MCGLLLALLARTSPAGSRAHVEGRLVRRLGVTAQISDRRRSSFETSLPSRLNPIVTVVPGVFN